MPENTQETTSPTVPAMPEGGSEKFYDKATGQYNWQAHAQELQFKLGQKADPKTEETTTEKTSSETPSKDSDGEVDLASHVLTHGDLPEAIRTQLEAIVPKEMLDAGIAAIRDKAAAETHAALEMVGGEEGWKALSTAMKEKFSDSPAVIKAYNARMDGPNWKEALTEMSAITGIPLKIDQSEPAKPTITLAPGSPSVSGYRTREEGIADFNRVGSDGRPLMDTDPAYREKVLARFQAMSS